MLLNLAYSPCPNDTYTYAGIQSGHIGLSDHSFSIHHHDIETLNQYAFAGKYEITKMSFHAWLKLKKRYRLCAAGNALGYGCGPIIISANPKIKATDLSQLAVVLPGELTTANLLFSLYCPVAKNKLFTTYDRIFTEIRSGRVDCGVVIHESRFLFAEAGFYQICDLGEWWEKVTGAPIPLGAVGIRNDLPLELDSLIAGAIRSSLKLSRDQPEAVWEYVKTMAQELDDGVIDRHIKTFVNAFTEDLREEGLTAVYKLEAMALAAGVKT